MILKAIANRRSIRDYKKDEVGENDVLTLIKAAQFAPSAKNNRSWEFIVVRKKEIKERLSHVLDQNFLKEAPLLIIPLIDTTQSVLPIQDISVASENIFLQAVELGLGTVWKNVWEEKIPQIKKILGVPEKFLLINIIPVGYPKTKTQPHDNKDFEKKKIHYEKF